MKKNLIKNGALILLSIMLTLVAVLPMQKGEADRSDWMRRLDDSASLNSITIPGTHDSGALHSIAEISGKCQSLSIEEQLKINKYRVPHLMSSVKRYGKEKLAEIMSELARIDAASKFGGIMGYTAIEIFVSSHL